MGWRLNILDNAVEQLQRILHPICAPVPRPHTDDDKLGTCGSDTGLVGPFLKLCYSRKEAGYTMGFKYRFRRGEGAE